MGDRTESSSGAFVFLFTDLEGSTQLWEQFPEAMKSALEKHDTILRSAVESSEGEVVKTTGDGLHAVFSSGIDGLNACIAAQHRLRDEPWAETGPLQVRMGLHIGEAQPRGGDYYGPAVNRAARLMAAGHGGQVLLSAPVANLVIDNLPAQTTLEDLGEHRLKDLERAEHIYQLLYPEIEGNFPPISSLNQRPNNLPTQTNALIGRTEELEFIQQNFRSDHFRLLTLTGPGGTGKTRLALQSAADLIDQFPAGAYFVDLAAVNEPEYVLTEIIRTIGLREIKGQTLIEGLKEQLVDRKLLLILDNFEQIMAAAVWVADLLQYCPQLKMIVTSREPLRVRGEQQYSVPPLGLPDDDLNHLTDDQILRFDALQLFIERARSVRPDFELAPDDIRAVAELCLRLDGLPLAIELAAVRIRLFSPQSLHQRLESRLNLLRGGMRDLPQRQQTLRDTITWSYELLEADEQTIFAVLSIFSGCTLDAAESVVNEVLASSGLKLDVIDGLFSLVDKSLMRISEHTGGATRLWMLETIREFASEKLDERSDLKGAARQIHAAFYAEFTKNQWDRLTGSQREESLEELSSDIENIHSAWRHWTAERDLEQLNKMVDSLWLLYDTKGYYSSTIEITNDLLNVLSSHPGSQDVVEQEILLQTSLARTLMAVEGYTVKVEQAYSRALELCDRHGEIPQLFPVLRGLSSYYNYRADFEKGAQIGERILQLAEQQDDNGMRIAGHLASGTNIGFLNDLNLGIAHLDKGIELFNLNPKRPHRFRVGTNPGVVCYTTSAFFLYMLGYPDKALRRSSKAQSLVASLDHPFTSAYAHFHMGILRMWRKEMDVVKENAQTLMKIAQEYEFQLWAALASILSGAAEAGLGRVDAGLEQIDRGMEIYQGLTTPPVFWPSLLHIKAGVMAQSGRFDEALKTIDQAAMGDSPDAYSRALPQFALLKGELLLAADSSNTTSAADFFQVTLEAGQKTGARMYALLAAERLCRLELVDGSSGKYCQILKQTYEQFDEGLTTADLIEAKELLDLVEEN